MSLYIPYIMCLDVSLNKLRIKKYEKSNTLREITLKGKTNGGTKIQLD
jgi:hypothetical protein